VPQNRGLIYSKLPSFSTQDHLFLESKHHSKQLFFDKSSLQATLAFAKSLSFPFHKNRLNF